ncbi:hypothetical protein [Paenibacillus glycanilyticus]|uniref:Uncharacterized protein n=1 Tax=Paenibacillus glycanilyticus TaxID=126569 RepID=A0ABQ6GK23_9BACL|nr:hypothetical protein [Paenibacillus glycanilyticus]GLX70565.1 hypothetical protein MU1_49110 [Paenibacillus glycanilyticus]
MRMLIVSLIILCILIGSSSKTNPVTASHSDIQNSMSDLESLSIPIYDTSAYDKKKLDEMGIKLNPTTVVPRIGKTEVRKITEDLLKQTAAHPKSIHIEYGLITANVGISEEAKKANPLLKDMEYFVNVPVWVVTFKGLLSDDYVPDHRGKDPLDINSTVIDANTGMELFGFGTGK